MKTYMIYAGDEPEEGAFLVFANTAREARKTGYGWITSLFDCEFTDVRVRRLWRSEWLFKEANQEKLARNEPHVIDNPKSCRSCGYWGQSPIGDDGFCEDCRLDEEKTWTLY